MELMRFLLISVVLKAVQSGLRISQKKCEMHSSLAVKCSGGRIKGGSYAKSGEYPHMAAIMLRTTHQLEFHCGGSLISEKFILTAAHCKNDSFPMVIRLGIVSINIVDDEQKTARDYEVRKFITHPDYRRKQGANDIALIELTTNVVFDSQSIRPACLQQDENIGISVVATGWGRLSQRAAFSEYLMKVGLLVEDEKSCLKSYMGRLKLDDFIKDLICAGQVGSDTCSGDSGGPIQVVRDRNGCMYNIVGVTNFGPVPCGSGEPSFFCRVSSHLEWIEKAVWH